MRATCARWVEQPVPFSHQHHVAGLGLDCRFCHTSVERSADAGLPPTTTCMTCHSQIWTNAALLAPVRSSLADDTPIVWHRVTDLPGYVYFNHSIQIAKGVGCQSCHGAVETMALTYKEGQIAHHGVLPRVSSQSGPKPSTKVRALRHRLAPGPRYTVAGSVALALSRAGPNPHGLLVVPPMKFESHPMWRDLEQAAADPAFLARAAEEFPGLAHALAEPSERRQILKLMAAAFVMAGIGGCDAKFGENLIPGVRIPPNIIPGLPNFYATAHVLDGVATGTLVKHFMGRPINVQGNLKHPASLGAMGVFAQAQLLDFYDPDRAAQISRRSAPSDREGLYAALDVERTRLAARRGQGLRILTGTVTSPTLAAQLDALQRLRRLRFVMEESGGLRPNCGSDLSSKQRLDRKSAGTESRCSMQVRLRVCRCKQGLAVRYIALRHFRAIGRRNRGTAVRNTFVDLVGIRRHAAGSAALSDGVFGK